MREMWSRDITTFHVFEIKAQESRLQIDGLQWILEHREYKTVQHVLYTTETKKKSQTNEWRNCKYKNWKEKNLSTSLCKLRW